MEAQARRNGQSFFRKRRTFQAGIRFQARRLLQNWLWL
jgi:hypothetical protein